jgi:hypothetical protein
MRNRLDRLLKEQMEYVVEAIRQIPQVDQNNPNSRLDDILNNIPNRERFVEEIEVVSRATMKKGGDTSVKQLALKQFGVDFSLSNQGAIQYFAAKTALELSDYRGNINNTTKQRVKEIVLEGLQEGRSYQETARLIREQGEHGVFSRARAELIAVHENAEAFGIGKAIPVQDFKARFPDRQVKKWWRTVNDDRVTDECQENQDASPIDFEELFPSGDKQEPRQSNPRCRCAVTYQII